ncbi:MAG: hypothetical protein ABI759_19670 [Candidatus Solibacter sp.]
MIGISSAKALAAGCGWAFVGMLTIALPGVAVGQRITDTSNGTLGAAVLFGALVPARATATTSGQVVFRLRNRNNNGYHVDASVTFSSPTTAPLAGGVTIAASDIGVGITSIVAASGVILPRADNILSGFNYNPSTVVAASGVTPFLGMASGQATLADLLASKRILYGNKIDTVTNLNTEDYLTVTMRFGLVPQYFTPGSFTATVLLTISNGP